MMATEDRPTTSERYAHAASTSNLTVRGGMVEEKTSCDADVILAAAYAASGDPMRCLALDFYRLRVTGDMRGFTRLTEIAGDWITGRTVRGRGQKIAGVKAKDLARKVLLWWIKPACHVCEGRGHPRIPDTPIVDDTRNCDHCKGTTQEPLAKLVKLGEADEARWLAGELDRLAAVIFSDMAKQLAGRMAL